MFNFGARSSRPAHCNVIPMTESTATTSSCPPPCAVPAAEKARWFVDEIHAHDSQLKAYLRGSFPSVRDVDDVVQESYVRIWKARAVHPIDSAKAFLFTVARNLALKVLRKNENAPFAPHASQAAAEVLDEKPIASEVADMQVKMDLLAEAVMTLPARCREIVILHKIEGLPQAEVAAQLGLSTRTVESQVRIGMKRCLEVLQQRGITNFYGDET